ncbi:MAG: hypothetical protein E7671_00710 [Ruminococcaceae bacterium]|nr:hypothetical protein [Oscillospiraceae bacterium]
MSFAKWADYHDLPAQQKRIENAKSAKNTPLDISTEGKSGKFSGSHGTYYAALEYCDCFDFKSRKLPCKHMYRLAMELGEFEGNVESDLKQVNQPSKNLTASPSAKNKALLDFAEIIEPRPDMIPWICKLLYRGSANNTCVCLDIQDVSFLIDNGLVSVSKDYVQVLEIFSQRNLLLQVQEARIYIPSELKLKRDQYQWCMDNAETVCNILYPNAGILTPNGLLTVSPHKIQAFASRRDAQLNSEFLYCDSEDETVNKLLKEYAPHNNKTTNDGIFENKNLDGLSIAITGILPSLSREEAAEMIKEAGGRLSGSVSSKTAYLVAGEEAGSKLQKAQELRIPIIGEAELLDIIKNNKKSKS